MAQDAECLEPLVDKPYVCHTCGVRYQTKRSLQRHNAEKHHERVVKKSIDSGDGDAKPFTCETCGKKYQESKSLRRHIRDYHSGVYFGIPCILNSVINQSHDSFGIKIVDIRGMMKNTLF